MDNTKFTQLAIEIELAEKVRKTAQEKRRKVYDMLAIMIEHYYETTDDK